MQLCIVIVIVLENRGQWTTCKRKWNNSKNHDKCAEDSFNGSFSKNISITNRGYSGACKVKWDYIHIKSTVVFIIYVPCFTWVIFKLACHNPNTCNNMTHHKETQWKYKQSFKASANFQPFLRIFKEFTSCFYNF